MNEVVKYLLENNGLDEGWGANSEGEEFFMVDPDREFIRHAKTMATNWKALVPLVKSFLIHCERCNMLTREEEPMVAAIREVIGEKS